MGRGNISQCNIDGIGKLQTSWIGQNGVCLNTVENLNASLVINFVTVTRDEASISSRRVQSQLERVKRELNILAAECNNAFLKAEMQLSQHPQIRKAMDLCSSYTASAGQKSIKDATSCAIGDLWKRDVGPENDVLPADNKQLATCILGRSMVDTLVEEDHQPPDISIMFSTSMHYRI